MVALKEKGRAFALKLKERIIAWKIKERMLALKSPSEIVRVWFHKDVASIEKVCTTCSHVGVPIEEMPGRREIELTLWSIFFALAVLLLFFVLVGETFSRLHAPNLINSLFNVIRRVLKRVGELFVFLSLIYTIYRFSSQREHCAKCNGSTVIPVDSPRAKELLKGR